jgi:hypothetical protein
MPVINEFINIPESMMKYFSALGIGIGVIGSYWVERKK